MAKIFVSHRVTDVDAAKRLAAALKANGHEVWLDKWEIKPGDSLVEKISSGLEQIKFLILCYSSSGVRTPWISREWMSALARQLNGASVRLIPVRLTGGSPPALLEDIMYVDFTIDWTAGMKQLCAALI